MFNQGTILGRVGKIATKVMSNGNKITNLSLVTSKKFVKDGQKQEHNTWHNVVLFSKLAEISESYVNVGDLLFVQGEMENQKYTTQDGQQKERHFLVGNEIKLMPKTKEHTTSPKEAPKAEVKDTAQTSPFVDDDVPW